jgi:hydroxymethylbilane synthase
VSAATPRERVRIGSRGSDLALWQARWVQAHLTVPAEITILRTRGDDLQHLTLDKVEGKGFFTKEIEAALLEDRVDVAVHSFKDLPTEPVPGLVVAAVPARGPVRDIIVRRGLEAAAGERWGLRRNARVGTSSLRRKAQISSLRPDLELHDLRGNVPTRINKVLQGELDAVILAEAGLVRLGYVERAEELALAFEPVSVHELCPAPAQGALAVQIRAADAWTAAQVAPLHDPRTARAVEVERALLARFGGGCHLPLGAHCVEEAGELTLSALIAAPDGSERLVAHARGVEPALLVGEVHHTLVKQGAKRNV